MARFVAWVIGLPLALLAVVFALANRHPVRIELWPLPWSLDLPAYLAVLGPLVAGIALGGLVSWLSGGRARRKARDEHRRALGLERQLEAARQNTPPPPAGEGA